MLEARRNHHTKVTMQIFHKTFIKEEKPFIFLEYDFDSAQNPFQASTPKSDPSSTHNILPTKISQQTFREITIEHIWLLMEIKIYPLTPNY